MSETTARLDALPLKWWNVPARQWLDFLKRREEQVFLVLTLVIGALVGLTVVAFIVLIRRRRMGPSSILAWFLVVASFVVNALVLFGLYAAFTF